MNIRYYTLAVISPLRHLDIAAFLQPYHQVTNCLLQTVPPYQFDDCDRVRIGDNNITPFILLSCLSAHTILLYVGLTLKMCNRRMTVGYRNGRRARYRYRRCVGRWNRDRLVETNNWLWVVGLLLKRLISRCYGFHGRFIFGRNNRRIARLRD